MKVLVLSSTKREPDYSCVYEYLGKGVDLDVRILDKAAQRNLDFSLKSIDLSAFDRILIDLRFKYIYRQARILKRLPGLVIYEQDACQNFLTDSRWYGRFSKFYNALPNARIVVTGFEVAKRLREEQLTVHFIAKGYDPQTVFYEEMERDIELGFIGRTASNVYHGRKELLKDLESKDGLQILRTEAGEPYRKMLNRIRYFVSADVGLGEYMAKNFEAMACGCVLLAWRQGLEEAAIGLEDGVHLLLYSSISELREHIEKLQSSPALASLIANGGRSFVEKNLTHRNLADQLHVVLQQPVIELRPNSVWQTLCNRLFGR